MTRDEIITAVWHGLDSEERAALAHALELAREAQLSGDGRERALQALESEKRALVRLQVRVAMNERKGDVRKIARRVAIVESAIKKLTEGDSQ